MELRLRELRNQRGLYQKDIAGVLGVDRTTYAKYETGDSEPTLDMLSKMADFFGVSIDYISGRKDKKKPTPVSEDGLSEEQQELVRLFKAATPALQAAALAVLRSAEAPGKVPDDESTVE